MYIYITYLVYQQFFFKTIFNSKLLTFKKYLNFLIVTDFF